MRGARARERVERGDFQTPLARAIAARVRSVFPAPGTVLEPTCGLGAFLAAAAETFPAADLVGIEIDPGHVSEARARVPRARVEQADFFALDWARTVATLRRPVLVLGNPPWVTSAGLGALASANGPARSNDRGLRGIEARTGASNFDISEWMVDRLLRALDDRDLYLAMIVKRSVTRKLFERLDAASRTYRGSFRPVDAKTSFGASVEAGVLELAPAAARRPWSLYTGPSDAVPSGHLDVVGGLVTEDGQGALATAWLQGDAPCGWRSGVKHDAAEVFELDVRGGALFTERGEAIAIEDDVVFPLLKGRDLIAGRLEPQRAVIVPQKTLSGASDLAAVAPRASLHFARFAERLGARKSSVFRGRPPHALFGIGPYSFAPFKVATSGLAKRLSFFVLGPHGGKPVMLDDTCYFLPFEDRSSAERACEALGSEPARAFFEARISWDAKRPVTKRLLDALALDRLVSAAPSRSNPRASSRRPSPRRGSAGSPDLPGRPAPRRQRA